MHCFSYHPGLVSTDVDVHRAMVQVLPSPVQVIASNRLDWNGRVHFQEWFDNLARKRDLCLDPGTFINLSPVSQVLGLNLTIPLRLNKFERGVINALL